MATIKAKKRLELNRSSNRKIRQEGNVLGVIYGKNTDSQPVYLDSIALLKTLRDEGKNTIITLEVDGKKQSVMVYELQTDPIKDELLHADFHVVDMGAEIDVDVPVSLQGEAQGVKDGGVLQQPLYELSIKAKPKSIPQTIEVDISALEMNEVITIGELKAAADYTFNHDSDEVVASILPPQAAEELEESEDEAAEPEVIGEKEEENKEE
ncbi:MULTISPECIES: 50S ribosomal protein L25/general stress protein Ctc [Bacillus]|uniref:Large ribosomal subunit protein bL25 n=2 Tax=Bacillus TaxID=1386 RepID=A0A0M4FTZ9_9BACI|nr:MULTISPECIES: 50S ribosomal protein L25/general stress protein Ctc [Bacillus]ALC83271.1 50S ribosomal protein L25 [Bacillus gobiensis]MBP1084172.1 large subunit ribosomal protein L25 [Bacillus capparidis]MED1098176.1 50S ribosomal protein L25/general stress protein Ctc [Bacillus capparidis]